MFNFINFLLFQSAWFITIYSAAKGMPYIGILFTLVWMTLHISYFAKKRINEITLLFIVAFIGGVSEFILIFTGMVSYPEQTLLGLLVPIWMIALWVNLGATINHSLFWLQGRYLLSALMAAFAGPLAYFAGQTFGAINLHGTMAIFSISFMWFCSMPLLFYISHCIKNIDISTKDLIIN